MKQFVNKSVERKILLNPGPATTSAKIKESLIVEDICPREKDFGRLLKRVGKKAAQVVNAGKNYGCVLLGGSGTGAVESCLGSCVDGDGGVIIVENGAYGRRMGQICEVLGIRKKTVHFGQDRAIDLEKVNHFLDDHAADFRVLAFVHHETTSGILNPLSRLRELAEKHHLISLVDAMSSYAGVPIDLEKDPVDYLISSSNKCIQGVAGIGMVVVKLTELEAIKCFPKRSVYFDLYSNFMSQKEREQFLFTPPVQVLYGLDEALDEFFAEGGVAARAKRYADLYEMMLGGMCALGFKPLLEERDHSKILTSFLEPQDPRYQFDDMHDYLYQRGYTIYPGKIGDKKTFRISNIGQIDKDDIQIFLQHIGSYLSERSIDLL